jgi:hypothetical protein
MDDELLVATFNAIRVTLRKVREKEITREQVDSARNRCGITEDDWMEFAGIVEYPNY